MVPAIASMVELRKLFVQVQWCILVFLVALVNSCSSWIWNQPVLVPVQYYKTFFFQFLLSDFPSISKASNWCLSNSTACSNHQQIPHNLVKVKLLKITRFCCDSHNADKKYTFYNQILIFFYLVFKCVTSNWLCRTAKLIFFRTALNTWMKQHLIGNNE